MCEGAVGGPTCKPIINHRKMGGVKTLYTPIYLTMNALYKVKIIILLPPFDSKYHAIFVKALP